MNLVITELSESDAVNRATERKCGGDEMGTEDPAAMLFLCSPAQGLLSSSQKEKNNFTLFSGEPSRRVTTSTETNMRSRIYSMDFQAKLGGYFSR